MLARGPGDCLEHCTVNPALESGPSVGLLARKCVSDLEGRVLLRQTRELVPIDHVFPSARRIQQSRRDSVSGAHVGGSERDVTMAEHRHQRHDPRTAGDEKERSAGSNIPNEVSADWAAKLEL